MGLCIYVAGKWELKARVREVQNMLQQCGHVITHDWTKHEAGDFRRDSIIDLRAVADADVFVGIFEEDVPYAGALCELGAALALGKPCYILGNAPITERCIFFYHPHIRRGELPFMRDLLGVR